MAAEQGPNAAGEDDAFVGRAAAFFRGSGDLLAVADLDGTLRQVNDAWRMLGWSDAKLLGGLNLLDLVHLADRNRTASHLERATHRGHAEFVGRFQTSDGGSLSLEWSISTDPEAGLLFARGADVTIRQEAERGLQESERIQRLLIDNLPATSLLLADRDLTLTYLGGQGHDPANVDPSEFVGLPMAKLAARFGPKGDEMLGRCRGALDGVASTLQIHSPLSDQYYDLSFVPFRNDPDDEVHGVMVVGTNVSPQRQLSRRAEELADMVSMAGEPVISARLDGTLLAANPAACRLFGYTEEELCHGRAMTLASLDVDLDHVTMTDVLTAMEHGEEWRGDLFCRGKDGRRADLNGTLTPKLDPDGAVVGLTGVLRDVTGQRAAERALQIADERFRASFDNAPIGKGLATVDGRWIRVNQALCNLLTCTMDELLATSFEDLTHPDDRSVFEKPALSAIEGHSGGFECEGRFFRSDRTVLWGLFTATFLPEVDGPGCFLVHLQDVTERRSVEANLRSQADLDPLTGLLNRRAFDRALVDAISSHVLNEDSAALLFLDLDGFKDINDCHGHPAGDQVLRGVAHTLRSRLRASDELGRLGGDEFGILLRHIGEAEAQRVAHQLEDAIREAGYDAGGMTVSVGASIGVARIGAGGASSAPEALAAADDAMYAAKRTPRAPVGLHAVGSDDAEEFEPGGERSLGEPA